MVGLYRTESKSHFKVPEVETPATSPIKTSALRLIYDGLCENGSYTALIEAQTDKTATYADILQQSTAIAAGLQSRGVTAGDYVALCCDNSILSYCVLLGTMFTGATAAIIPPPFADRVPLLMRGHVTKAVFCEKSHHDFVSRISPTPSLVVVIHAENPDMVALLSTTTSFILYDPPDIASHVAAICFSSGTTGHPKGVQITDFMIQQGLISLNEDSGRQVLLFDTAFFWGSSFHSFIASIRNLHCVVLTNQLIGTENLRIIAKYKVTLWKTHPSTISQYMNEPTLATYDLSSVTCVLAMGSILLESVTEKVLTKVLKKKVTIITVMGCTEVKAISSNFSNEPMPSGFCGKLLPGVEVKIVNDNGEVVPIGCLGEMLVKTPAMTPGYFGQPQLTEKHFDEDGFFHSGDVCFFDKDGNIYHRGRVDDLINYRGVKISPVEVENVLMSHQDVIDVAVVGQEHPEDIQWMTAFVVIIKGSSATSQELQELVDGQVEDTMKLRGGVHLMDALPRVAVGKVIRKVLREKLKSWKF